MPLPCEILNFIIDNCSTKEQWYALRATSRACRDIVDSKVTYGLGAKRLFDSCAEISFYYSIGEKRIHVRTLRLDDIENLWNSADSSLLLRLRCTFINFLNGSEHLSMNDNSKILQFVSQAPDAVFKNLKRLKWWIPPNEDLRSLHKTFKIKEIIKKLPMHMDNITIPYTISWNQSEWVLRAVLDLRPRNVMLNLDRYALPNFKEIIENMENTNLDVNFFACDPEDWDEATKQFEEIHDMYIAKKAPYLLTMSMHAVKRIILPEMPSYRENQEIKLCPFKVKFYQSNFGLVIDPIMPHYYAFFNVQRGKTNRLKIIPTENIVAVMVKTIDGYGLVADSYNLAKDQTAFIKLKEFQVKMFVFTKNFTDPRYIEMLKNWLLNVLSKRPFRGEGVLPITPNKTEETIKLLRQYVPASISFESHPALVEEVKEAEEADIEDQNLPEQSGSKKVIRNLKRAKKVLPSRSCRRKK